MKKYIKIFAVAALAIFLAGISPAEEDLFARRRQEMVETQIRHRGINDKRVLSAMLKVPRQLFVPQEFWDMAYEDTPLPIRFGQTISQPYIVAFMTEALKLGPEDRVLEIGTGSGYQSAILAELVKDVYSVEIIEQLAEGAKARLESLGYKNIHIRTGDGSKGWPEEAPFDAIIVTAAPLEIPEALVKQLKAGGRMMIPVGAVFQQLYLVTKTKDGYDKKALIPVKFVPLVTPYKDKERHKAAAQGAPR